MREIKFRAWIQTPENSFAMVNDYAFVNSSDLHFCGEGDIADDRFCKKVISVMQYTGIKDKNGKEIYEGDVAKLARYKTLYTCKWDNKFCMFYWGTKHTFDMHYMHFEAEVIGNIYENHEFLEVK